LKDMTHAKSPIKKVELGQFVDRHTMRFVREYPHPIERVWSALTDPAQMKIWWMPCSLLETHAGGRYVLESPLGNAKFEGRIKECEPPRLIDFSGVTRFELSPHEGGCRLVLTLKRWPMGWNPVSLAGFHAWLDHLRLHLDGFDYDQIMELARVWQSVYAGYAYLIQLNLADGAKVIHRVHFAEGDGNLRDSMKPVLDEVVRLLGQNPSLNLQIDGFCDDPCSYEDSFRLADARVKSVADYLCAAGIARSRFFQGASGNTHMIVPSDAEEGRAFNRRVELRPTW